MLDEYRSRYDEIDASYSSYAKDAGFLYAKVEQVKGELDTRSSDRYQIIKFLRDHPKATYGPALRYTYVAPPDYVPENVKFFPGEGKYWTVDRPLSCAIADAI